MAIGATITSSVLAQSGKAIHAIALQLIDTAHLMDLLLRYCTPSSTSHLIIYHRIETSLIN